MKITKVGEMPSFQCKGVCDFCGTEMEASSNELDSRKAYRHEYIYNTFNFRGEDRPAGGFKVYTEIAYFRDCVLCKKEVIFNEISGNGS